MANKQKNVVMDATLLSALMVCERKMDLRHNQNLVPIYGKSKALEMGSLVHKILESYYKSIRDGRKSTAITNAMQAGEDYYKFGELQSVNEQTGEKSYEPLRHTDIEDYNLILDTMGLYFEKWINDSFTPVDVESVKSGLIFEDDDIRLIWKAKFDLISDTNNGFISTDHKTMKQRRETLALNNQFMGQCVLLNTRNVIINKIGFQTSLKIDERFSRVMLSYTSDQLIEFVETAGYFAKYLVALTENDYFPPRFTSCESKFGKCEYYENLCNVNRNMRGENARLHFMVGKSWEPIDD